MTLDSIVRQALGEQQFLILSQRVEIETLKAKLAAYDKAKDQAVPPKKKANG